MIKPNSMRANILANYDEQGFKRLGWKEFALKFGTTEKYVQRLSSKMSKEGILPETPESRAKRLQKSLAARTRAQAQGALGGQQGAPKSGYTAKPGALDGILNLAGAMPRGERLRILSEIASSGQDIAKIQAITRLEEFERAAGTNYGPPPPTTKEDTVKLLVELMRSIPAEWVAEAIGEHNGAAEPETAPKEVPESSSEEPLEPSGGILGGRIS